MEFNTKSFRWGAMLPAVLATLLGLQAGRMVFALITPVGPTGQLSPAGRMAVPAALAGDFDPFFRQQGATGPSVVTALPIKLFGTRLDGATGRGFAIIALPDGQQSSFAVGELVMPGVKLWSVARDEVTIDRNGARERLFLDQSIPPAPLGGAPAPPASIPTVNVPLNVTNDASGAGRDVVAPSLDQSVPAMPQPASDQGNKP
jgi:general secretion pathway protein C